MGLGLWIHVNPWTHDEEICNEGPFVFATRSLSVLKGSPQLAMHFRDQVSPETCKEHGFGVKLEKADHCYPANHIWTRKPLTGPGGCNADWGCAEAVASEA